MNKNFKRFIAAATAVTAIAFGGISASATTADDVVAAARGAGIAETYVMQLDNYLRANEYTSEQYDKMIGGLSNIRSYSLDLIQQYLPEVDSYDDLFGGGGSSSSDTQNDLDPNQKPAIQEAVDKIKDDMTAEDMLPIIQEVINTGKELGLDITAEQTGETSFILTAKDKDGNVKLVMPIGKLISKTGVETDANDGFMTVAAICAVVMAAGGMGAWLLSRKNEIGE